MSETEAPSSQDLDPQQEPATAAEADPRQRAFRLACTIGGVLMLVAVVAMITSPLTGGALTLIAGASLAIGLWDDRAGWPYRRALPHMLAVVLAGMSILGLCASSCGTYEAYESFLGLPTAMVGGVMHVLIVLVIVYDDRRGGTGVLSDLAIASGIGASGFYGTLLLTSGTWCGACVAIHTMMLIQLIELLRAREGVYRLLPLTAALAAALAGNAVYHHRLVPAVRDDASDLLAYLRSQRLGEPTIAATQVTSESRDAELARLARNLAVAQRVGEAEQRGDPLPSDLARRPAAPVPTTVGAATPMSPTQASVALRPASMANRWGPADAPVALMVLLDTGCPACRAQFPQILLLRDLVEKGQVQVRFLLTYRNEASQASATIGYAAGMAGEEPLLATLRAFYADQSKLLTPADVLEVCPEAFPKRQALDVVSSHQQALTDLLADAVRLRDRLGTRVEPTLWLFRRGDGDRPSRVLTGLTGADVLRVAITNLGPTKP